MTYTLEGEAPPTGHSYLDMLTHGNYSAAYKMMKLPDNFTEMISDRIHKGFSAEDTAFAFSSLITLTIIIIAIRIFSGPLVNARWGSVGGERGMKLKIGEHRWVTAKTKG